MERTALHALVADRPVPAVGDARRFVGLAHEHGLSGLLRIACHEGRAELPAELADRVEEAWRAERAWCAALDLELERVVRTRLRSLAVPILLKGPAVADRYTDPGLRPYVDVDLLVPPEEVRGWGAHLEGLGYRGPGAWREGRHARFFHHVAYRRPGPGRDLLVELHRCPYFERNARWLEHDALAVHASVDGPAARLGDAAQLLVVALHLVKHRPEERRLIWVRDLVELGVPAVVRGARILAEAHGLRWAVEETLAEAEAVLGEARWGAEPVAAGGFGMQRVSRVADAGFLPTLAKAAELRPSERVVFFATALDPRRFSSRHGTGEPVGAWLRRQGRKLVRTPWTSRSRGMGTTRSGRGQPLPTDVNLG